jgi:hypothetical protein
MQRSVKWKDLERSHRNESKWCEHFVEKMLGWKETMLLHRKFALIQNKQQGGAQHKGQWDAEAAQQVWKEARKAKGKGLVQLGSVISSLLAALRLGKIIDMLFKHPDFPPALAWRSVRASFVDPDVGEERTGLKAEGSPPRSLFTDDSSPSDAEGSLSDTYCGLFAARVACM